MWNLHFYPTLLLFVTRTSARCWQPGKNPYWLAAPVFIMGVVATTAGLLATTFPETLGEELPETMEDAFR